MPAMGRYRWLFSRRWNFPKSAVTQGTKTTIQIDDRQSGLHVCCMWQAFHHPDISLPVVRRRIGLELVEMLDILGDVAIHGGWAFLQKPFLSEPECI